jgi:hypothetical protein
LIGWPTNRRAGLAVLFASATASAVFVAGTVAAAPSDRITIAGGDWPPGAPVMAAVTVHRGARTQLAIADLLKGTFDDLGASGEDADAAWSPDGACLAYRSGSAVYVTRPGNGPAVRVRDGLLPARKATHPFAFSPDSRFLAVATERGLEIVSVDGTAGASEVVKHGPSPALSNLTWSSDGQHLAGCRWDEGPKQLARGSAVIATLDGEAVRARTLPGEVPGCKILGPRNGDWLMKRSDEDQIEEVLALSKSGHAKLLIRAPVDSFVTAYLADADMVVETEGVDDEGDPTRLTLAPLSRSKATPWLRHVPELRRLVDPPGSAVGRFVLVTVQGHGPTQSGPIVLASLDGKVVRQVLPALGTVKGKVSFSAPIPRPSPVTRR